MSRFSMTFSADTLDELYSSVASFIARPIVTTTVLETSNGYTLEGVQTTPAAPVAAPVAAQSEEPGGEAVNTGEFDSAGIPWDERIHAGTRGVNQDGTWKRRRNTSDVIYASVMAELSQRSAGSLPAAAPVFASPAVPVGVVDQGPVAVPSPVVVPAPQLAASAAIVPTVPVLPVAAVPVMPETPAAPVVTAAPEVAAPQEAGGMPFQVFMPKISAAMQAGKFDQNALNGWLAQWQLSNIMQLQADPIKAEQFYGWLKTANMVD